MTTSTADTSQPEVVQLEGGPITVEPIEQLVARRDALTAQARELDTRSRQLREDAVTKARDGATYLVAQRSHWDTSGLKDQLSEIDALTTQIDEVDRQLAEMNGLSRNGLGGFFKRFGDRQRRVALVKQRDQLADRVKATLATIGARAPEKTVPDADALLCPARQESELADTLHQQSAELAASVTTLTDEIGRRQEAIKKLGFDALWTAAWLQNHEPAAIESPVTLKRGEVAWVSVGATLLRQATRTQWTGTSQGVSFPIGHTGIRYRVGGYRGHPIQTTVVKDLDTGSLVVTNQRIVFIGRIKSVTVVLSHVVHVEAFTDALGVFQDKRETPDFFKLQAPQHVLFYINYAISRLQ